MRQALHNALRIAPARTLLTHHDPAHTDQMLLKHYHKLKAEKKFAALDFEFAREDHVYEVRETLETPESQTIKKAG
jgi:uncharacterized protein (DUF433 family)